MDVCQRVPGVKPVIGLVKGIHRIDHRLRVRAQGGVLHLGQQILQLLHVRPGIDHILKGHLGPVGLLFQQRRKGFPKLLQPAGRPAEAAGQPDGSRQHHRDQSQSAFSHSTASFFPSLS